MSTESSAESTPLVSVVVATNRVSPFLAEALGSVAAQTHARIETIVVDDGSPDPDAVQAAVEASMPSAIVLHRKPAGVSAARNTGISAATGDFAVFLDDDDVWHPERLARQVERLQNSSDAVACYCGMRTIDADGNVLVEADQIQVGDRLDVARRVTGILAGNLMVRRTDLDAVGGFDQTLRLAEDLDLVLKLSERGPFVFAPGALFDYRLHGTNHTARHRALAQSIRGVVQSHRDLARTAGDAPLAAAHGDSLRANGRYAWWAAMRSASAEARNRRFGAAASDILWAMRFAPWAPFDAVRRRLQTPS